MNLLVTCPECNKSMKRINGGHIKTHSMTYEEFCTKHPNTLFEHPITRAKYGTQSPSTRQLQIQQKAVLKQHNIDEYNKHPKKCERCNNTLPYSKRINQFCNRSCSQTHHNLKTPIVRSEAALKNLRILGKTTAYKNIANKLTSQNNKCYIDFKRCGICTELFVVRSKSKNKKLCGNVECASKWHSLYNFKQNPTRGKCGHYKGIWCASSWELAFVAYNMHYGTDIQRFNSSIVYEHHGKHRRYFPDFYMNNQIYEVKGRWDDTVDAKIQAAKDAGYKITIIGRYEIMPIICSVQQLYHTKDITTLYDKMGCMTELESAE